MRGVNVPQQVKVDLTMPLTVQHNGCDNFWNILFADILRLVSELRPPPAVGST